VRVAVEHRRRAERVDGLHQPGAAQERVDLLGLAAGWSPRSARSAAARHAVSVSSCCSALLELERLVHAAFTKSLMSCSPNGPSAPRPKPPAKPFVPAKPTPSMTTCSCRRAPARRRRTAASCTPPRPDSWSWLPSTPRWAPARPPARPRTPSSGRAGRAWSGRRTARVRRRCGGCRRRCHAASRARAVEVHIADSGDAETAAVSHGRQSSLPRPRRRWT
jgi:hypothetical protein